MTPRAALRLADPASGVTPTVLDDQGEALLREILATEIVREPADTRAPRRSRPGQRRPAVVTAVVALVVVAGAIIAIRSVPARPTPADGSRSTAIANELQSAIFAKLVEAAGSADVPSAPSLTWTESQRSATGGPIDLTGKRMYLAAACTGGGSIAIQISGVPDTVLDCSRLAAVGPIDLSTISKKDAISVDVTTRSGQPTYIAKAIAVTVDGLKRNARGQTYGPDTGTEHPDLIAAVATNGRQGYVSAKDEAAADPCRNVRTPAAAASCSRKSAGKSYTVPVYESDGTTRIGVFRIGG